jgi:hypothetical protein
MRDSNLDPAPPAPSADAGRTPRTDGKVYCCPTLGFVDLDTFFEHRWDTSRPLDEYLSERASAWEGIEPGV